MNKTIIAFLVLIISLKWYLISSMPIPYVDAVLSCTPSFSFLMGYGSFNIFTCNIPANLFGFIGVPFFYLYDGPFPVIIFFELTKIFLCVEVYLWLKKSGISIQEILMLTAMIFMDRTVNYYGEEVFLIALMLFLNRQFNIKGKYYILFNVFMFLLFFILHPLSALVFGVFTFFKELEFINHNSFKKAVKNGLIYIGSIGLLFAIYFRFSPFGEQIIQYSINKYGESHFWLIQVFITISSPIIVYSILLMRRYLQYSVNIKLVAALGVILFFICFFQGNSYGLYLIIFLVYFLSKNTSVSKTSNWVLYIPVIISFIITYVYPVYTTIVFPEYYSKVERINKYLGECLIQDQGVKHVPAEFLGSAISRDNIRLVYDGNLLVPPKAGEAIFLTEERDLDVTLNQLENRFDMRCVIKPSNGLPSLFRPLVRVKKYGLWEVKVVLDK